MDLKPRTVINAARHPALLEAQRKRAESAQLRIADWITMFAGSI